MDYNEFDALLVEEEYEIEFETNGPFISQSSGQLLLSAANQSNECLLLTENQCLPTDDNSIDANHLSPQLISNEDINTENLFSNITLNVDLIESPQSVTREEEATNEVNNFNKRSNKLEPKTKRKANINAKCVSMPSVSTEKDKSSERPETENKVKTTSGRGSNKLKPNPKRKANIRGKCVSMPSVSSENDKTSESSKTKNKVKTTYGRGRGRPSLNRSPEEKRSKVLQTNQKSAENYRRNQKLKLSKLILELKEVEKQNYDLKKNLENLKTEKTRIIQQIIIKYNVKQETIEEMLKNYMQSNQSPKVQ